MRDYTECPSTRLADTLREAAKHQHYSKEFIMREIGAGNEIELWEMMADAIEASYLPIPLMEDGYPISVGTETERGKIVSFDVYDNGNWLVRLDDDGNDVIEGTFSQRVALPDPKDTDGVPVKTGDVLFDDDDMYLVTDVDRYTKRITFDNGSHGFAHEFSHEPRIYDIDTTRTRVNDTVWDIDGDGPYKVMRLPNPTECQVVTVCKKGGVNLDITPMCLTHVEPESMSKIMADFADALDASDCFIEDDHHEMFQSIFYRLETIERSQK